MAVNDEVVEWRGIKNLVIAKVITDTLDDFETGEVKKLAGISKLLKTTDNSSETKYYDDVPALITESTGADTVTCDVSAVPAETIAEITGQIYLDDLGVLVEGERQSDYWAMGYETAKTNGDIVYVWRLKGKFSIPDSEHNTKTAGTESNGQQVVYTGINTTHVFTKIGKTAKAVNVEVAKKLCDVSTFFDSVQTPDTLKAPTV